jgi:hypothetical protein
MTSGVELLQADQLDQRIACGPIGQLSVEARPAITSESRSRSVVPLHGEQVAGPAQPLEVAGTLSGAHDRGQFWANSTANCPRS